MTLTQSSVNDTSKSDKPNQNNLKAALAPQVARRNFVLNVASNIAYIVLNTIITLWYTPFLIHNLGIAAYGMIPLANSLVNFVTVLSDGLNVAINRFLVIDLNRLDENAANQTFNTALIASVLLVSMLLLPGVIIAWFFPFLFQVLPNMENSSRLLFGAVILTDFMAILGSSFAVSTMALHRFDLRNIVRGLAVVLRSGLVVLLFSILPPQIWHIAAGYVVAATIIIFGDWLLWRKLTPQLHVKPNFFNLSRLKALMGLGGWAVVNQLGALLFLNIDLMVVNYFFGIDLTGRYGTILIFATLIHTLASAVGSVLSPAIGGYYARGDFVGLRHLASQASKLMGLGLAIPIGLLCGFGQPLLKLWLGSEFIDLNFLLIALVGHLSVNLATRPLLYVLTSYNKVRIQGILTIILGIINIGFASSLAYWGGWGITGVAIAGAITWTVKNLLLLSVYSAIVMGLPWKTFFRPLVSGAVGTIGIGCSGYGLSYLQQPNNWVELGTLAIGVIIVYAIVAYFILMNYEDRKLINDLILHPLQRRLH